MKEGKEYPFEGDTQLFSHMAETVLLLRNSMREEVLKHPQTLDMTFLNETVPPLTQEFALFLHLSPGVAGLFSTFFHRDMYVFVTADIAETAQETRNEALATWIEPILFAHFEGQDEALASIPAIASIESEHDVSLRRSDVSNFLETIRLASGRLILACDKKRRKEGTLDEEIFKIGDKIRKAARKVPAFVAQLDARSRNYFDTHQKYDLPENDPIYRRIVRESRIGDEEGDFE